MVDKLTPAEKVKAANDDYHEAIDEVMLSEDYDIATKVAIGRIASGIFAGFNKINKLLVKPPSPVLPEPDVEPEVLI